MRRRFIRNIRHGVYIEGVDSKLYTASDWTGSISANSIVVIDNRARFRISLSDDNGYGKVSDDGTIALESVLTEFPTSDEAKNDFNSLSNTEKIISLIPSADYAAGFCYYYQWFPNNQRGVLPSLGWLYIAYENLSDINDCLDKCGGTAFYTEKRYGSSTYAGIIFNTQRSLWGLTFDGAISKTPISLGGYNTRAFAEY